MTGIKKQSWDRKMSLQFNVRKISEVFIAVYMSSYILQKNMSTSKDIYLNIQEHK